MKKKKQKEKKIMRGAWMRKRSEGWTRGRREKLRWKKENAK